MDARRLAWVLLICSGAVVLLLTYYAKSQKNPTTALAGLGQPATSAPSGPSVAAKLAPAPAPRTTRPARATAASQPAGKVKWVVGRAERGRKYLIGSTDPDSGYLLQVETLSDGAAVNTVKLGRHYATVEDKKLAEDDRAGWEEAQREEPEKYLGSYSVLNPVTYDSKRHLPLATRRISVTFADKKTLSWNLGRAPWRLEKPPTSSPDGMAETICFSWTLYRDSTDHPVLKLTKTYTVRKEDYTIEIALGAKNLSSQKLQITLDQSGPTGLPREDVRADMRKAMYGKLSPEDEKVQAHAMQRDKDFKNLPLGKLKTVGTSTAQDPVLWIGQTNKFFGAIMYLLPTVDTRLQAPEWNAEFYVQPAHETADSKVHLTGLRAVKLVLAPNAEKDLRLELFTGPKRRGMFVDENEPYFKQRYRDLNYISTIDLRSCFCAWDWLSLTMIQLLAMFSKFTLGNYGLAIMVLVILVRLLLHPLTKKSQVSMSKMKKLSPMMKELEKKYANDKDAMNRERMKMYKKQGFTPLLGCLPIALQMPILIALWTGINASVGLRHAAFLPVWITDLAAPDALFSWAQELPMIGKSFNLLPLLLGGAMYWQMTLNPQTQAAAATPEQQKQQKMMQVMMVLMMPLLFYKAASGLTLYFMVSTFFGAAESHFIRKHIEAKEEDEALRETTVVVPGKGPRGSRQKKPKGPLWFKRG